MKNRAALPCFMLALALSLPAATELYVSPDGDDTNDGSKDAPFATLYKARDMVRTLNESMSDDIIVYLRGHVRDGYHYLDSTLTFDERDGGRNGHSVIFQGYTGEQPIVSGGIPVTGWEAVAGTTPTQYKAHLDHDKKIRHMFVNYTPAYRSRGPKILIGEGWKNASGETVGFHAGDFTLANPADVELFRHSHWAAHQYCVERIENPGPNAVFVMQHPYWIVASSITNWSEGKDNVVVENAPEFIDQPGEFAFDRPNKTLYYLPRAGQDMASAKAIVNGVEVLVRVNGSSPTERVSNLVFRGIGFHNDDYQLVTIGDSHGYTTVQGIEGFARPVQPGDPALDYWPGHVHIQAAMKVLHAENIVVDRCRFEYLGGCGVDMVNDVHGSVVNGNVFNWLSATAVVVGHAEHGSRDEIFPQPLYPSPAEPQYWIPCKDITVSNNLIRNTGYEFTQAPSIQVYFTENCAVNHNDLGPTGHTNLNLGWGWNQMDPSGTAKNNRISSNRLNVACQAYGDCGVIYTLGHQPGTVIDSNYIYSEGTTSTYNRWSDEWDPASSRDVVHHNCRTGLYPDAGSDGMLFKDHVYEGLNSIVNAWWGGGGNEYDGLYYPLELARTGLPDTLAVDFGSSTQYDGLTVYGLTISKWTLVNFDGSSWTEVISGENDTINETFDPVTGTKSALVVLECDNEGRTPPWNRATVFEMEIKRGNENLALNKPISGNHGKNELPNAVDGDRETFWKGSVNIGGLGVKVQYCSNIEWYPRGERPPHVQAIVDNAGLEGPYAYLHSALDWTPGKEVATIPSLPHTTSGIRAPRVRITHAASGHLGLRLDVASAGMHRIELIDTRGRIVKRIHRGYLKRGTHTWHPGLPAAGYYLLRISSHAGIRIRTIGAAL